MCVCEKLYIQGRVKAGLYFTVYEGINSSFVCYYLLVIVLFHMNNSKPTVASPCISTFIHKTDINILFWLFLVLRLQVIANYLCVLFFCILIFSNKHTFL